VTAAPVVCVSARTYERDVGGNTTYVRNVYAGLSALGLPWELLRPPAGRRPRGRALRYAGWEGWAMQAAAARRGAAVAHYPADTGPLRRHPRVRTAVTLHGVGTLVTPGLREPAAAAVWLWRARRAARVADVVITCSDSSRQDILRLADGAFEPAVEIIPHAVDHDLFRPASEAEVAAAVARHGLRRPFVLFVGNLEPRKNVPELVRAVEALGGDLPGLELVVVGRPAWEPEATLQAIERSPSARRLERVADAELRALMTACSALALPSLYEGFGLPVLEAMACGAPAVCTRRGALEEVAGDAATYAEDVTAAALADALRRSLSRPREHWEPLGIARAAGFTWSASAEGHRRVLERLAAG
jgi:alpha-1,3-rhamnosyl/mannosyltransferase